MTYNPDLFIADSAAQIIGHDLATYSNDCNARYRGNLNHTQMNWHCGRYLDYLGCRIGAFCGLFT